MNDFKKLSDFEKNLFLKKQIEYLKGLLSRAGVTKALALKDPELKEYLATADFDSQDFNPFYYRLATAEMDLRNKK